MRCRETKSQGNACDGHRVQSSHSHLSAMASHSLHTDYVTDRICRWHYQCNVIQGYGLQSWWYNRNFESPICNKLANLQILRLWQHVNSMLLSFLHQQIYVGYVTKSNILLFSYWGTELKETVTMPYFNLIRFIQYFSLLCCIQNFHLSLTNVQYRYVRYITSHRTTLNCKRWCEKNKHVCVRVRWRGTIAFSAQKNCISLQGKLPQVVQGNIFWANRIQCATTLQS